MKIAALIALICLTGCTVTFSTQSQALDQKMVSPDGSQSQAMKQSRSGYQLNIAK